MPYTITISKTETVTKTVGKHWEPVSQRLAFPDIYADGRTISEYGYTPEIENQVEVTTEILKQTVDDLDLNAVIKAVNKL